MLIESVRLREPGQACGRKFVRDFPSAGLVFWYNVGVLRAWATMLERTKQISRAGNGRAHTPGAPPSPRTWDASDESLRNFAGKTRKEDAVSKRSFASFGASFRALSGASCDASEEVFVFRPADV